MSQEQTEAKLVEQTESVVEIVKKINEALKDTRIAELCEKLRSFANALDAVIKKKHYVFKLHFYAYSSSEYKVQLYVDDEHVYTTYMPIDTQINAMFEKIFASQTMKEDLVGKIHEILSEIAKEIAEKANLIQRIKEIEERLEEEDP